MSSADFAAAQARLAARRQQREADARARTAELHATNSAAVGRLPFPLRNIGSAGLSAWNTISGREGTRPSFRVGQVDAELLDEELLELLKGQVGEALKYYGTQLSSDYSSEILLLLRAILFKLTLWDHDASYGAALQGLRYTDAREKSLARPPPKRWQKLVYGFVTVLGRYGWEKWEQYLVDVEGGFDEQPTPLIRRLSSVTTTLDTTHSLAALASFLTFLYNGTHRTILDRVLRLRLVPRSSQTSREVSFEYLNRQLVWHAFTEFLLFLLPLVGISRWRRIVSRAWRRVRKFFSGAGKGDDEEDRAASGELGFLPERTCAICYADQNPTTGTGEAEVMAASSGAGGVIGSAQTDITNPYEAIPCGDVYCFVCLAQKIDGEEGEGWTCLRCGEVVKECKPWSGDVIEETTASRPASGNGSKSVGFADDGDHKDPKQGEAADDDGDGRAMRDIDPRPVEEEGEHVEESYGDLSQTRFSASDNSHVLDDSGQWASTLVNGDSGIATPQEDRTEEEYSDRSDEDEQSEEYDEEEDLDIAG